MLEPIAAEFRSRGLSIQWSEDVFHEARGIGIYACHANLFFDFEQGGRLSPRTDFSVVLLHDLNQDNAAGGRSYFANDRWDVFDLGVVPGPSWMAAVRDAEGSGILMPRLGVVEGGWPPLDAALAEAATKARKSPPAKTSVDQNQPIRCLVACSWYERSILDDLLAVVDAEEIAIVLKLADPPPPVSEQNPWKGILQAACREYELARDHADAYDSVTLAPPGASISELLSGVDLVISNGSSIMFEGLLWEVPGICVRDWVHPTGERGVDESQPYAAMPGLYNATLSDLPLVIDLALTEQSHRLATRSGEILVRRELRGRGLQELCQFILDASDDPDAEYAQPTNESSQVRRRTSVIADYQDQLRLELSLEHAEERAREQAAREQAAREQAAREQAAREQAAEVQRQREELEAALANANRSIEQLQRRLPDRIVAKLRQWKGGV